MEHHLVDVFVGPDGGGNALAVFLDAGGVGQVRRQGIAAELGLSETVFVDDVATGRLEIFTPAEPLPFAGHPLVGTAWLLAELGRPVEVLRPPAGDVPTWQDGSLTWVRGRPEWAPAMGFERLADVDAVDALGGAPDGVDVLYAWAWDDEPTGRVRSRMFAPGLGIAEDEATGAAAVRLAGELGRDLVIRQGAGSELLARPRGDGTVDLGGRCRGRGVRTLAAG